MKNMVIVLITIALISTLLQFSIVDGEQVKVAWIKITGYISPATLEYVRSAFSENVEEYDVFLITLDTLGGDASSTLEIIKIIQLSEKPVLCLVYPEGADAMSAGTFILMACHLSGMAPNTLIGACQPVVGGAPSNDTKLINFLVEKMISLARTQGRNETAARDFVTKNLVLNHEEALRYKVVEVVARDPREFLEKVDGMNVKVSGRDLILNTRGSILIEYGKPVKVLLMEVLSDPLISSILLAVGIMTLLLGLTSPGFGAEIAGGIMILLGLIGQGFNVNLVGLLLVVIGAGLLVYEIFTQSFGAMAIGGIISLSIGIILIAGSPPRPIYVSQAWFNEIITNVTIAMIIIAAFFGFLIYKTIKAIRMKPYLKEIPGKYGKAVDHITPSSEGYVMIEGELWRATSREEIKPGDKIKVVGRSGRTLIVEKIEQE
ncbi:MAG: nodulation protein NfeD [Nitrososphaerota archaeon]